MPAQGTAPLLAPERQIVPALLRVRIVANRSTKDRQMPVCAVLHACADTRGSDAG